MIQKFLSSTSEPENDNSIGPINIFNYLIDVEEFFIINIDPRVGSDRYDILYEICEEYISELYDE